MNFIFINTHYFQNNWIPRITKLKKRQTDVLRVTGSFKRNQDMRLKTITPRQNPIILFGHV
jgi:hypothetical protein